MDRHHLIAWRKALHISQTTAAASLGMSRRAYQALETGETPIDTRTDYASQWIAAHVELVIGADGPKAQLAELLDDLRNLPNRRREPAAAYNALLKCIDRYLDIMEMENRQPDVWERLDLNDCLNALSRADLFGATEYLRHAITPLDDRSGAYPIPTEHIEATAGLDVAYFRRCSSAMRNGVGSSTS